MTRRAFLVGGGGAAAVAGSGLLVEQGYLPGRSRMYAALGLNGEAAPVPDVQPGPERSGTFESSNQAGREVGWAVSYPPGSSPRDALPVALALHASQGTHRTILGGGLYVDRFLALAVAAGVPPFAVAAVDGGPSWLPQGSTDTGRTVTMELVPLLEDLGLDTARLAFLGWSAGGLGALVLGAGTSGVRAVGVTSPALSDGDVAFDVREAYEEVPLRVDCGRGDPFYHAVKDFVDGLDRAPEGGFNDGGHTHGYWRRMAPEQLEFIGQALA